MTEDRTTPQDVTIFEGDQGLRQDGAGQEVGEGQGHQDRLVPVLPGLKPTYKMVGFSQYDGPMFEEDVTADRAQEIA